MKNVHFFFGLSLILLFNSCVHKHEWIFIPRDNGKRLDTFFLKTDYDPENVKIHIAGNLNKEAKLVYNIINPHLPNNNDSEYSELDATTISLPKGKVDITVGKDLYSREMNFIYLPQDSTISELTIKIIVN